VKKFKDKKSGGAEVLQCCCKNKEEQAEAHRRKADGLLFMDKEREQWYLYLKKSEYHRNL
jgi:hypothetical protein